MTPEQAYEWLAPKLSIAERGVLDVIMSGHQSGSLEDAAKICDDLASLREQGAGLIHGPGSRLRQAARMIRELPSQSAPQAEPVAAIRRVELCEMHRPIMGSMQTFTGPMPIAYCPKCEQEESPIPAQE